MVRTMNIRQLVEEYGWWATVAGYSAFSRQHHNQGAAGSRAYVLDHVTQRLAASEAGDYTKVEDVVRAVQMHSRMRQE